MNKFPLLMAALLITGIAVAQTAPKGLATDTKAPDFTANDQQGNIFNLQKALAKGPVVVVFYRGQWCPYCNRQLKKLEDSLSFITAKGATLVAVTPEKPENINKTIEKTDASYPILYDDGLKIMRAYDVAFDVDDKTIERYKRYGIDFNIANGTQNGDRLPVPAVYIIKKDGSIAFRHFDPDYTKRTSVAEMLKHL